MYVKIAKNDTESGKVCDIALMDIYMPGVSGTDAAEAFAMNATHCLLNPFTQEQFDAALDRAIKKTEDQVLLSPDCVNGVYRVRSISGNSIEMQNGAKISVPQRSFEKVQRMYMEYCRKEARK